MCGKGIVTNRSTQSLTCAHHSCCPCNHSWESRSAPSGSGVGSSIADEECPPPKSSVTAAAGSSRNALPFQAMLKEKHVFHGADIRSTRLVAGVLTFALFALAFRSAAASEWNRGPAAGDVSGTITDSTSGQPLPSAEVSVNQNGSIVTNTQTDGFGRYTVHNLSAGSYVVSVRMIGFRPLTRTVTIAANGGDVTNIDFKLVPAAVSLTAVTVTATVPIAVDT